MLAASKKDTSKRNKIPRIRGTVERTVETMTDWELLGLNNFRTELNFEMSQFETPVGTALRRCAFMGVAHDRLKLAKNMSGPTTPALIRKARACVNNNRADRMRHVYPCKYDQLLPLGLVQLTGIPYTVLHDLMLWHKKAFSNPDRLDFNVEIQPIASAKPTIYFKAIDNWEQSKFYRGNDALIDAVKFIGNDILEKMDRKGFLKFAPAWVMTADKNVSQPAHTDFKVISEHEERQQLTAHTPLCTEGMDLNVWPSLQEDGVTVFYPCVGHINFGEGLITNAKLIHSGVYGTPGNIRFHMVFKDDVATTAQLKLIKNVVQDFSRPEVCRSKPFHFSDPDPLYITNFLNAFPKFDDTYLGCQYTDGDPWKRARLEDLKRNRAGAAVINQTDENGKEVVDQKADDAITTNEEESQVELALPGVAQLPTKKVARKRAAVTKPKRKQGKLVKKSPTVLEDDRKMPARSTRTRSQVNYREVGPDSDSSEDGSAASIIDSIEEGYI
jgi:hypothetical protein